MRVLKATSSATPSTEPSSRTSPRACAYRLTELALPADVLELIPPALNRLHGFLSEQRDTYGLGGRLLPEGRALRGRLDGTLRGEGSRPSEPHQPSDQPARSSAGTGAQSRTTNVASRVSTRPGSSTTPSRDISTNSTRPGWIGPIYASPRCCAGTLRSWASPPTAGSTTPSSLKSARG